MTYVRSAWVDRAPVQFQGILEQHDRWLKGAEGSRANLSGADLSGAKIFGKEITKAPVQISGLHWHILITDSHMKIGCELHEISEWLKFKDSRIKLMDSYASKWWKVNKGWILKLAEQHMVVEDKGKKKAA
jgi:hypothetical protein